jgi:hypothetical protein
MPPRDPGKTAINRKIAKMTARLEALRPYVMGTLGSVSLSSLHAVLGSKNAKFIEIRTQVLTTPQAFYTEWLVGLEGYIEERGGYDARYSVLLQLMCTDAKVRRYVRTFLMRTFLRQADALSKKRPTDDEAEIWMGPNHTDYGLLVTPRFSNGQWENDKSEIRHFKHPYFSIGHVLETGLVIPGRKRRQPFHDIDAYLSFFENTLVRLAGSLHQNAVAERYVDHVKKSADPYSVPLLLPEVRYSREKKHQYRLDFMVVEPSSMRRIGFELSPWSSHGRLLGIGSMTQKQINAKASENRATELAKLREYFLKHGISIVVFTDDQLKNPDMVFEEISTYLGEPEARTQQEAEVMARLRKRVAMTLPSRR